MVKQIAIRLCSLSVIVFVSFFFIECTSSDDVKRNRINHEISLKDSVETIFKNNPLLKIVMESEKDEDLEKEISLRDIHQLSSAFKRLRGVVSDYIEQENLIHDVYPDDIVALIDHIIKKLDLTFQIMSWDHVNTTNIRNIRRKLNFDKAENCEDNLTCSLKKLLKIASEKNSKNS